VPLLLSWHPRTVSLIPVCLKESSSTIWYSTTCASEASAPPPQLSSTRPVDKCRVACRHPVCGWSCTSASQVGNIAERLLRHASTGAQELLVALWGAVSTWLLGSACGDICRDIEADLWRFYMVSALKEGKQALVKEFLAKYGSCFPTHQDWSEWYALGASQPSDRLACFFEQSWSDNLELSLHNVLATALAEAAPLRIAQFEIAAQRLEAREVALAEHKKAMYEVSEELLMTTDQLHKLQQVDQHDDHSTPVPASIPEVRTSSVSSPANESPAASPSPAKGEQKKSSWRQPFSMIKDGLASLRKDSSQPRESL